MNNNDYFNLERRTMDLVDLNVFRTVVSAGGITRAAEQLHRVQSNVTTRIRQLEEDLGVQLFIREGKRMHVSPAGRTLLGYADRLLDLAREAREAVHEEQPSGLLRLGAMESTAAVRLPAPLSEYHGRYPAVTLELRTGNPGQLASAILEGEIDAAFAAEPIADAPFEKVAVFDEELVIVAPASHPRVTSPRDAREGTILVFEHGCPHRRHLEEWFARSGETPGRRVEMSSYHAMLGCVIAGMGVSLVPKSVLDAYPERKRLAVYSLPAGQDRAQTVLFWRKGADSPKLRALVEILLTQGLSEPRKRPKRV
jgi:DNA-binding transcriptional LysR family regulator